jgi:NodT family efflux transporter outer membrane factor (OMF) lipoprotein
MERRIRNSRDRDLTAPAALVLVLVVLVLSGCGLPEWARNGGKVGPNYKVPPAEVAANWIDYQDPRVTSEEQDLSHWWGVFADPVLDSLITQAYEQNLSLRVAGERIVESRARRGIAVGNLFPQVQQAAGAYTANKVSSEVGNRAPQQWFSNWEAGFNVAWELDLWGRFRRSIEAADADLQASVANFDDVLVVLLADVSANYVQYRISQERIAVAHRNVVIQEKSYQLAQDRFKAGASTERDVQQAKQILEQTRALIPQLEGELRRAANALCVLLGMSPRDLSERLGTGAPIPSAPAELALGIPADLLRRRPDVRRIERQAAAQSALIGVAKSDLYPRLSLLGSIGVRAEDFGDLFKTPGSIAGSVGPAFHWDILNYGRIESNVQIQESRFRQSVLAYQETVLRAGREAEDAAVSFLKAQERARFLNNSVAAASRTVEITYDQFSQGVIDFTPVFLFEETLADQEDQLAIAQGQIALSLVDLYRALGGGWEMRLRGPGASPPPRAATTQPTTTSGPTTTTAPAATTGPTGVMR